MYFKNKERKLAIFFNSTGGLLVCKKCQNYIKYYLNCDGKIPGYKKIINIIKKI